MNEMTVIEAIKHLMKEQTKYSIAKKLDVEPIMIDRYLNGSKMKKLTAKRFKLAFGIIITDIYVPGKKDV